MNVNQEFEKLNKEGLLIKSHTSYFRGYVSRVLGKEILPYEGRFGKGFKVLSPNWESTTFSFVTYYIK